MEYKSDGELSDEDDQDMYNDDGNSKKLYEWLATVIEPTIVTPIGLSPLCSKESAILTSEALSTMAHSPLSHSPRSTFVLRPQRQSWREITSTLASSKNCIDM